MLPALVALLTLVYGDAGTRPPCAHLSGSRLTTESLVKRVSVGEAERANMFEGRPFGYQNERWRDIQRRMRPGDELWLYRLRRPGSSQEGYVLLRSCEAIDEIAIILADGPVGTVKRPVLLQTVQPTCANQAKCTTVVIEAVIRKSGSVDGAKIVKGKPSECADSALVALAKWKYQPATLNGQPVEVLSRYRVAACRITPSN